MSDAQAGRSIARRAARSLLIGLLLPWLAASALLAINVIVMWIAGFFGWVLFWLGCWGLFLISARRADTSPPRPHNRDGSVPARDDIFGQ